MPRNDTVWVSENRVDVGVDGHIYSCTTIPQLVNALGLFPKNVTVTLSYANNLISNLAAEDVCILLQRSFGVNVKYSDFNTPS